MAHGPRTTECDLCGVEPGEHHPDVPIRFCSGCLPMFEEYRRAATLGYLWDYGTNHRGPHPPGPAPKLTAFRLGELAGLFPKSKRAKLERIAEGL